MKTLKKHELPDISVKIGNIKMRNPITTASGTYGQGEMFNDFYDINILGALTTKSVTLNMRPGNPPPRIAETSSGYLNSIGLQNPGVDTFIIKYKEYFDKLKIPIIISIAGNTVKEYGIIAKKISDNLNVHGIEINISCPNVKQGGLQFSSSPKTAAKVVKEVRKQTNLTLITKLTPNTDCIIETAKACINEGTDAIAAINTLKGMAINLEARKPMLANVFGGLSGPAVKPIALRFVYELASNISVPIIGMGGISNAKDALEFILAGASAVSIGTANFYNPLVIPEVLNDIVLWLKKNNIKNISELRGKLIVN